MINEEQVSFNGKCGTGCCGLTGEWEDNAKRDVNLDKKDVNLGNSLKTFGCKEVMSERVS